MKAAYVVGQHVWIYSVNSRGSGPREATITKVGRTLVTTDRGWYGHSPSTFRMDGGHRNDQYGHEYILTDEEKADQERREVPMSYLREKRISGLPHALSTDALDRIVAVIKADLGDS